MSLQDEDKQLIHFVEVVNDIIEHFYNASDLGTEVNTVFKE